MDVNRRMRWIHFWVAVGVFVPVAVILGSGLVLQMKKHWSWVQPAERTGTGGEPVIGLEGILESVKGGDGERGWGGLVVRGWEDVNRIDVRPGRGVAKVWLRNGWEVQVDTGTGRVLGGAYRRSDLIEAIHDGSFFGGDVAKLGVFLPSGAALLVLWVTGVWLGVLGLAGRRRRGRVLKSLQRTG